MKHSIIIVLFFIASCGGKSPQAISTQDIKEAAIINEVSITDPQMKLMNIQLGKPQKQMLSTSISSPGKVVILSQYQASITAKLSGTIEEIHVLEGQRIAKGQKLMTISSPEFVQLQESYLTSKSEAAYLKSDFDRQQSLRKENIVGEKDFQLVKSKYETAFSRMRSAEARLKILGIDADKISTDKALEPFYEVRSPIAGFLYKLPVSLGMGVTNTTEVSHVVNMEKFHADIFVYEKDINAIYENQPVEISFANPSLQPCKGTVEFISRGIDPIKRSIIVHVVFNPPTGLVLPDMTVKATFLTKAAEQLTVPSSALIQEENEQFVFVGKHVGDAVLFSKVRVKTGATQGDMIAIMLDEPLTAGAQIAETGTLLIDGEMKKATSGE